MDYSPSQVIVVTERHAGQRLDNFLLAQLKDVPRTALYRFIRTGQVRINGARAKPTSRVGAGDGVRIPPLVRVTATSAPPASAGLLQSLASRLLHDDGGLIIIDKPAGLAVHGGSGVNLGLVEALRQLPGFEGVELVHRLDRDTSGCLMLARKPSILKALQAALRARSGISKTYLALVEGRWPPGRRQVDLPLERYLLASGERRVRVSEAGKPALTEFAVERSFPRATLVAARPISGRTHQIRVHARAVGHPLVGDDKYGAPQSVLPGAPLCLHASTLEIDLPDLKLMARAPLPDHFVAAVEQVAVDVGGV